MVSSHRFWARVIGICRGAFYGVMTALTIAIGGPLVLTLLSWGAVTPVTLWPPGLYFQVTVGMMMFGAAFGAVLWAVWTWRD